MRYRLPCLMVALVVLLGLLPNAASAAEDTDAPRLTSVERVSPAAVAVGDTIRVKYSASDASGLQLVAVHYENASNTVSAITASTPPDTGEATLTIATHAPAGPYRAVAVFVRDRSSSQISAWYKRDGSVEVSPYGATGPSQHSLDLASLDVTVTNPDEDLTGPALDSLERTSADTLRPGDEVHVAYGASDANGVHHVHVVFIDDYGRERFASVFPPSGPNVADVVRFSVGSDWASGAYRLERVTLTDASTERNIYSYYRDLSVRRSASTTAVATHSFPFATLDFTVENDAFDSVAPTLESLSRTTPATVTPGQRTGLTYRATDNESVMEVTFQYYNPVGTPFVIKGDGPLAASSEGGSEFLVPSDAPAGTYRFAVAVVRDINSNRTYYFSQDDVRRSPSGATGPSSSEIDFRSLDFEVQRDDSPSNERGLKRLAGSDRYATAAEIAQDSFPSTPVPVLFIATGEDFADALAGGPAADMLGGPVLPVAKAGIPSAIRSELSRLDPARIVILGGAGAVSDAIAAELQSYTSGSVTRMAGRNRYDTAAQVAQQVFAEPVPQVIIATGLGFADALAGGAVGALTDSPVLLVAPKSLPAETAAALRQLQPDNIAVLGGPAAVSDAVLSELQGYTAGSVTRLSGDNRYSTGARIVQTYWPHTSELVYVATGRDFSDALAGIAAAGLDQAPLLLTEPHCLPAETKHEMDRLQASTVVVLGGTATVSDAAAAGSTICGS